MTRCKNILNIQRMPSMVIHFAITKSKKRIYLLRSLIIIPILVEEYATPKTNSKISNKKFCFSFVEAKMKYFEEKKPNLEKTSLPRPRFRFDISTQWLWFMITTPLPYYGSRSDKKTSLEQV